MKVYFVLFFFVSCSLAKADDPIVYNSMLGPFIVGDGECFVLQDVTWPECTPPQSCAYTLGFPQAQSPSVVQDGSNFYLVPSWWYECPNTASGRTDVAASIPSQLCIGTSDISGKENRSETSFVCFVVTDCDFLAIASNVDHPDITAEKKYG